MNDASGLGCCLIPAMGIGLLLFLLVLALENRNKKRAAAEKAFMEAFEALRSRYAVALQALRENPVDPLAREAALQAGREYSEFTRSGEGVVALFDEVALMNDINAAAAAAPVAAVATPPVEESPEQRLAKLEVLKEKGLVTDDEYQETRKQILSGL